MQQTRRDFARYNVLFRRACALAGLRPSRHQAKHWRLGQGTAYGFLDAARAVIREEDAAVRFPKQSEPA